MVPFRTFRGPLFPKPVTGQELFLAVSYSKPALRKISKKYIVCRTNNNNVTKDFEDDFLDRYTEEKNTEMKITAI